MSLALGRKRSSQHPQSFAGERNDQAHKQSGGVGTTIHVPGGPMSCMDAF